MASFLPFSASYTWFLLLSLRSSLSPPFASGLDLGIALADGMVANVKQTNLERLSTLFLEQNHHVNKPSWAARD